MANQKGWSDNPVMTPDQAVEKVAQEGDQKIDVSKSQEHEDNNKHKGCH